MTKKTDFDLFSSDDMPRRRRRRVPNVGSTRKGPSGPAMSGGPSGPAMSGKRGGKVEVPKKRRRSLDSDELDSLYR